MPSSQAQHAGLPARRPRGAFAARRAAAVLGLASLAIFPAPALPAPAPAEPVATFSIVGCDPEAGEVGIAVQSKFFAVGAVVPWAKANVGAIATQSYANTTFGPRGLRLLEEGLTPQETLDLLLATDPGRENRQVGIVDATGRSASFTGTECLDWAGGSSGPNFAAQGNILVSEETAQAMARGFVETEGMLGEKLMRALELGQKAGGDSRGKQSAAILIVREGSGYAGFDDRYCDLRVDDHAQPIVELRRIFDMWKGEALIREGYVHVETGDFERAIAAGEEATRLEPQDAEPYFHLACFLSRAGRTDDALGALEKALQRDSNLATRAQTDPDLEPLRGEASWATLVGVAGS